MAWSLFVDGSYGKTGSRVGVILVSSEGRKLSCAIRFGFKVSNNAAEHEAFLAGLKLSREMQVKKLMVNSNSQLVVNKVNGNFAARDKGMASYFKKVMESLPFFEKFE